MPIARHPLPTSVLREVDEVVTEIRARRTSRLDVDRLAGALGVQLAYSDLGATLLGLTLDENRVVLKHTLRGAHLQLVFAHELAHVMLRRGRFREVSSGEEEWFADWFARELVLPRRWLLHRWPRPLLGALHVEMDTVALQMAALGRCPALMRNGCRVLCGNCGTDAYAWDCACRTWRNGERALHELPDVRELQLLSSAPRWGDAWLSIDTEASIAQAA